MGRTLSVETGVRCNNRCTFCYQMGYRGGPSGLPDPTFEELAAKLEWGRENGHDEVGFSGGEPTIRRDFLDLVRRARELGYRRVSLTTNGRRFSNASFAREAVAAGLDSIGWSLHGARAETHDRLVGREGAFKQVLRGMENIARAGAQSRGRLDQNLFVLVNRRNLNEVTEICRLGRSKGIKLMILQPVIYSKGNLAQAASHRLPLTDLVFAIRAAARQGRRDEYFVKLFNLPPCFFPDDLKAFEHQRYPVSVFRYQEEDRAGETRVAGRGYVRLDRCASCRLQEVCPGLHQSLLPQDQLLSLFLRTVVPPPSPDFWLAGLELFDDRTLTAALKTLHRVRAGTQTKVYTGGESVAGDRFPDALRAAGIRELSLVLSDLEEGGTELAARAGGNALQLEHLLSSSAMGRGRELSVSLAVPFVDSQRVALVDRLEPFARAGLHLEVQLPWDFKNPEVFEFRKCARLAWDWYRAGGKGFSLVVPAGERAGTALFRLPMRLVGPVHAAPRHYARHFFASPLAGWIGQSVPPFARVREEEGALLASPLLFGLPGRPITDELLAQMRPG